MKINAFPMWYEIWKGRKKSSAKGWFEPRSIASKRPRHAPYHLRHWNWWFVAIFYNIDYPTEKVKVKVTWHTAKYGNPYSELVLCIYPFKVHTHSSEHTHTWTHTRSSGQPFMLRRQGSSWGFGALLKGTSVVVLRMERALVIHSPHLQFLPDLRLEPTTFGLRARLSNHWAMTSHSNSVILITRWWAEFV